MSESALRLKRREIRRAFGPEAVQAMTVGLNSRDSKIAEQDALIRSLSAYIENLDRKYELKIAMLERRIDRLMARRIWHRDFWKRG